MSYEPRARSRGRGGRGDFRPVRGPLRPVRGGYEEWELEEMGRPALPPPNRGPGRAANRGRPERPEGHSRAPRGRTQPSQDDLVQHLAQALLPALARTAAPLPGTGATERRHPLPPRAPMLPQPDNWDLLVTEKDREKWISLICGQDPGNTPRPTTATNQDHEPPEPRNPTPAGTETVPGTIGGPANQGGGEHPEQREPEDAQGHDLALPWPEWDLRGLFPHLLLLFVILAWVLVGRGQVQAQAPPTEGPRLQPRLQPLQTLITAAAALEKETGEVKARTLGEENDMIDVESDSRSQTLSQAHQAQIQYLAQQNRQPRSVVGLDEERLLFTAYDCSQPVNLTTIATRTSTTCRTPNPEPPTRQVEYALLQRAEVTRFPLRKCRMRRSRVAYVCANAGHTTLVPEEWIFDREEVISGKECLRTWQNQAFDAYPKHRTAHQKYYPDVAHAQKVKVNSTTYLVHPYKGHTYAASNDVHCSGHVYELENPHWYWLSSTPTVKNMVVYDYLSIELVHETGLLDRSGKITTYETQTILPCSIEKEQCTITAGTYIWSKPEREDTCPYYLSRDVTGVEFRDELGTMTFLSSDGSMVRLRLQKPISRCGGVLYPTEFDTLFLAELQHSKGIPQFRRALHESEMSVATYANQQDSFLYQELEEQIAESILQTQTETCQQDRERTHSDYAQRAAEQQAISDGETVRIGGNQFVTAAGEVWYHYQCRPVLVRARKSLDCHSSLPVSMTTKDFEQYLQQRGISVGENHDNANQLYYTRDNQFFMEPKTRRLVTVSSPSECAKPFAPVYQNQRGDWLAYDAPGFHIAPPPAWMDKLVWDFSPPQTTTRHDFGDGGIYTAQQIASMDKFSQAPRAREGVAAVLTNQYQGTLTSLSSVPATGFFPELPPAPQFNKIYSYFQWIWDLIEKYGQICSVLVGTALIVKILVWLLGVLLRLATIPLTGNLCVHIAGALFPSFRDFLREPAQKFRRFFNIRYNAKPDHPQPPALQPRTPSPTPMPPPMPELAPTTAAPATTFRDYVAGFRTPQLSRSRHGLPSAASSCDVLGASRSAPTVASPFRPATPQTLSAELQARLRTRSAEQAGISGTNPPLRPGPSGLLRPASPLDVRLLGRPLDG